MSAGPVVKGASSRASRKSITFADVALGYAPPVWLVGLSACLGGVAALWGGSDWGASNWYNALAVAGVLVSAGMPSWRAWAEASMKREAQDIADETQQAMSIVVARVLAPIAERLAELPGMTSETDRAGTRAEVLTLILDAATELAGCPEPRAVLYKLGTAPKPRFRELTKLRQHGRQGQARSGFERGDPKRSQILDAIDSRRVVLVEDTNLDDPGYYGPAPYRTYCSAPIYSGDRALGLLSVDSPMPDSIPVHFKNVLEVLASLLALVMT